MVLLGVDASALLVLLNDVTAHPVVQLAIKSVPAVAGLSLVAYLDAMRGAVLHAAAKRETLTAAAVLLIVLLYPQIATIALPAKVPLGTSIIVDSALTPYRPEPTPDAVTTIPLRGFREHVLIVARDDAVRGTLPDTLRIDRWQIVAALWPWDRPEPISTLAAVGGTRGRDAALLLVRGRFPRSYANQAARTAYIEPIGDGEFSLSKRLDFGFDDYHIDLPPNVRYTLSYLTRDGCRSASVTVTTTAGAATVADLPTSCATVANPVPPGSAALTGGRQ
ncbi:MAG TPA: hypothetical protein VGD56_13990 [Gemmatirosa sp.]